MKKYCLIVLMGLVFVLTLAGCKSNGKNWDSIIKSAAKWESFDLQKSGIKAAFPKRPTSKMIAYSPEINFYENYAESDSVTYSINLIEHKNLADHAAWNKFLNEEVLAFKALERKNIKVQGREAVWSKVRENNLFGYSINLIIDNKYVANIAIRYKGDFPSEKLLNAFVERVKF